MEKEGFHVTHSKRKKLESVSSAIDYSEDATNYNAKKWKKN